MTRRKGTKAKGSNKKSQSQRTSMTVNVKDEREASRSDEVPNLKSPNECIVTSTSNDRKDDIKASTSDQVTNLRSLNNRKNDIEGSKRVRNLRSLNDRVISLRSLNDIKNDTEESKRVTSLRSMNDIKNDIEESKTATNLRSLNEFLMISIDNNRKEIEGLKHKLKMCNDANNKLLQTTALEKNGWISCEKNMKCTILELQNKLDEARNLSEDRERLFSQLGQEKNVLENRLKESNNAIKELLGLKNELDQTKRLSENLEKLCTQLGQEKNELQNNLENSNDVITELQDRMTEDRSLWDASKEKLEATIVEVQAKHDKELLGLKNELDQTKQLSENLGKLCTQLGQEKNELQNNLKKSNDVITELQDRMTEDRSLWDASKTKLEATIVEVQAKHDKKLLELKNELDQTKQLSENLEKLCTQLGQEKNELQNNLEKSNDVITELQDRMTKDRSLWDASKKNLEATFAEVQAKLDSALKERNVLSQIYEDLYTSYKNDKNKLKKCNDGVIKLKAKMNENQEFWDSCRVILEGKVAELQNKEVKLKNLNDLLLFTISSEREDIDELKNKLKMCDDTNGKLLETMTSEKKRWISCEENMRRTISGLQNKLNEAHNLNQDHEKIFSQLEQEKNLLERRLKESSGVIEELQGLKSELDQTKQLSENLEKLCAQLGQEKNDLQNNLKRSNDVITELQDRMTEDRRSWDASKTKLEATIVEVQAKLDSTLEERDALNQKHEELCTRYGNDKNKWTKCNESAIKLKEKMLQDKRLWDSFRVRLEGKIAELQNGRVSLEGQIAELQNEILVAKKSSQTHQELLNKSRQENILTENKLRKINDSTRKMNAKMTEDKKSWDSCKKKLEAQVSELQNELMEHKGLCSELKKENNELEYRIREYNNETTELKAKLSEGGRLWHLSITELEAKVSGLQTELNEIRLLSLKHEEACIRLRHEKTELEDELKDLNNTIEDLQAKMTDNGCTWDACKEKLTDTIVNQQKKLNETKILAHNNQVMFNEISREKSELENKFNQSINEVNQLKEAIAEQGHLWDICKGEFIGTIAKLQNELNEARMLSQKNEDLWSQSEHDKNELQYSFSQSIEEAKQLKEKLAEDRHAWDTCKGDFEVTIANLQNELSEMTMLSQKHEALWSQSGQEKNELEKTLTGLQNELKETEILRVNDQDLCNKLREENNRLGNKLKQCNGRIKELNAKIKEDEQLWVSTKIDLEHKIREGNDRNKELYARMKEDSHLWEACKAQFEESVAGLQNKLDMMSNDGRLLGQEYVELCIECEFLKAQLGDYNGILSSMEDETWSLMSLSESNAKTAEALQTQVQLITHERVHLSKKYEELNTENESLKLQLENHNHRVDSVENERKSPRSMFASKEEALLQEIGSLKQKNHELEIFLGMWANDYKQVETSDVVMENLVTENRTAKQEALQLDQENQLSEEDMFSKQSLLQTKDGKTEMNGKMFHLRNPIKVLDGTGRKNRKVMKEYGRLVREEQVKRKESEAGICRVCKVSHWKQTPFVGELISYILLHASKGLCSGTKCILPSDALLSGCSYGWFGGIV